MSSENPGPGSGRLRSIANFLGLRRSIVALLAMAVLVGLGERMAERFLPLYLLALGAGLTVPGLLNALDNLLSALYSFPGGYLADRIGTKRALLLFNLIALAGYAVVIAIPTSWAVFAGSFLFLSWSAISLPATMGLVNDVLPRDKRTMGVTLHSLVRRVPMALGPILGGVLIDRYGTTKGVRIAFAVAAALGVVALVLQQVMIAEPERRPGGKPRGGGGNPLRALRELDPSLRKLLASDILVRFCEQIPYAYVVIWCVREVGVSGFEFGVLTTIEMATAMLVYLPVAWLADRGTKKPYVLATFGFFTLFPLALFASRSFAMLAVAFVVRGLKEFGEPTRKALILDLAPDDRKASAFGAYYLARDVVVAAGAATAGFLWQLGPRVNFLTAAVCGFAGTVLFALQGRDRRTATGS
jgi:MFS family permease